MSVTRCTECTATTSVATTAALDASRAAGWRIWDGVSVTGKPLNVRLCPACSGCGETEEPAEAQSWRVGCRTCDWEWGDEYNEGPLTEKDAREMARDHECEPDTWVKPPESAAERATARLVTARVTLAGVL